MNPEELLQRIAERLDPDEIIDRLGLTSEQVVSKLSEDIFENIEEFYDITEEEE